MAARSAMSATRSVVVPPAIRSTIAAATAARCWSPRSSQRWDGARRTAGAAGARPGTDGAGSAGTARPQPDARSMSASHSVTTRLSASTVSTGMPQPSIARVPVMHMTVVPKAVQ